MEIRFSTRDDLDGLMLIRMEMLRVVNCLKEDDAFPKSFLERSRAYFSEGKHATVIALEQGEIIGCATMAYIDVMPTFSHPTGVRGHLMNVYTREAFRRQGIARNMVQMLITEARNHSVTEISLDATPSGRPLYRDLGFVESEECMVLTLQD